MTKAIALLSILILILMMLALLGQFWFVYGIWPRSWGAFTLFFFIQLGLYGMMSVISKDDE